MQGNIKCRPQKQSPSSMLHIFIQNKISAGGGKASRTFCLPRGGAIGVRSWHLNPAIRSTKNTIECKYSLGQCGCQLQSQASRYRRKEPISDTGGLNSFPTKKFIFSSLSEIKLFFSSGGAWLVAYREEQKRRFDAVLYPDNRKDLPKREKKPKRVSSSTRTSASSERDDYVELNGMYLVWRFSCLSSSFNLFINQFSIQILQFTINCLMTSYSCSQFSSVGITSYNIPTHI